MKQQEEEKIRIRIAVPEDAEALLDIYRPYVEKTAITFEYEAPSIEEFRQRICNTLKKYPYLVAERNSEILGYAYTGPFIARAAYDWSVETSIYLKMGSTKQGIGKRLYKVLEDISRAQNIINMYACIGYPETEDEHLTNNSVEFHGHIGFCMVGKFYKCGYKFGTWYHMAWMEKLLTDHPKVPQNVIAFPELQKGTQVRDASGKDLLL